MLNPRLRQQTLLKWTFPTRHPKSVFGFNFVNIFVIDNLSFADLRTVIDIF